jgi:hypothetical protein
MIHALSADATFPAMVVTVTCEDGAIRHAPFASMAEARTWAEWGHCCTNRHRFTSHQENPS